MWTLNRVTTELLEYHQRCIPLSSRCLQRWLKVRKEDQTQWVILYPLLYMQCKTLPDTSRSKRSIKQNSAELLSSCSRVLQDSNSSLASSMWCNQRKLNNTCKDTRVTAQTVTLSRYMLAVRIFLFFKKKVQFYSSNTKQTAFTVVAPPTSTPPSKSRTG